MGGEQSDSSPLMAPAPIAGPSEIDLEAGPDEQIQCRICLETDGKIPNVSLSSFICELVNLLVNLGLNYAVVTAVLLFLVSTFMWTILRGLKKS